MEHPHNGRALRLAALMSRLVVTLVEPLMRRGCYYSASFANIGDYLLSQP